MIYIYAARTRRSSSLWSAIDIRRFDVAFGNGGAHEAHDTGRRLLRPGLQSTYVDSTLPLATAVRMERTTLDGRNSVLVCFADTGTEVPFSTARLGKLRFPRGAGSHRSMLRLYQSKCITNPGNFLTNHALHLQGQIVAARFLMLLLPVAPASPNHRVW